MKRFSYYLLLVIICFSCKNQGKQEFDVLIYNANIVDVESGKIITNQLVGITSDTIRLVKNSYERHNYTAKKMLDAKNKFLMPGLWDMHVHFRGGDSLIQENKEFLSLFLAYGITSVRDAGGDITPIVLEWKKEISEHTLEGPTIFSSGPKLDGIKPAWPGSITVSDSTEVIKALDSLQKLHVNYVKMYDGSLTKQSFYQIIEEAEKRNLKTTGHMPLSADILKAIDLGLDGTEHMYYTLKATSPLADSLSQLNLGYGMMDEIIDSYDLQLATQVFSKMAKNNFYVTPTLHIGKTLSEILETDHTKDSLLNYVGAGIQKTYQGRIESAKRSKKQGNTMRQKLGEVTNSMMKPMYIAGVNLLAGSDSGAFNSYVYPGESLHQELQSLVAAGLTPQEALTTSVINGPKFFDLLEFYGGVQEGKIADLIILKGNPLQNIQHTTKLLYLIKNSRLYSNKDLVEMIQNE